MKEISKQLIALAILVGVLIVLSLLVNAAGGRVSAQNGQQLGAATITADGRLFVDGDPVTDQSCTASTCTGIADGKRMTINCITGKCSGSFDGQSASLDPSAESLVQKMMQAVSGAGASGCGDPLGVPVNHEICKNPKATTCGVIYVPGGVIPTICQSGCCRAAPGYTTGTQSTQSFFGSLAGSLVQGALGALSSFLGQSSGSTPSAGDYRYEESGVNLGGTNDTLQYDVNTLSTQQDGPLGDTSFLFETIGDSTGAGESNTGNNLILSTSVGTGGTASTEISTTQSGQQQTQVEGGGTSGATGAPGGTSVETGGTVSTTYEYVPSANQNLPQIVIRGGQSVQTGSTGVQGDTFFDSPFGSADTSNTSRGLSLYDLEQSALEEQTRGAGYQSLNANTNLQDYRSATIAQSDRGATNNPLSAGRYDVELASDTSPNWFTRFALWLAGLFGGGQ